MCGTKRNKMFLILIIGGCLYSTQMHAQIPPAHMASEQSKEINYFPEQEKKETATIKVHIDARKSKPINLKTIILGKKTPTLEVVSEAFTRALTYTDQFVVDLDYQIERPKKQDVLAYKASDYNAVLLVSENESEHAYEWRLFDTKKAAMQKGFRVPKEGKVERGWGYALADSLITAMTNSKPFACSKLTYCETTKKGESIVWVTDFDGTHAQQLSKSKRQIIASSWNKDPENPLVLYSKYTPLNIQLISCSLDKNEIVASSFDGLNMQPAFSNDGKEVVLCLSRDGSSQLYHYGFNKDLKQVGYTRLTYNTGNNFGPTFLDNGNLVFCSDFELGRPQLYYLDRKDDSIERLTQGQACVSPQYSSVNHSLVYSKMVQGTMQLFLYDLNLKKEKQITFDAGHKQECAWLACGNYIGFVAQEGEKTRRIATYSLLTGKKKYITSPDRHCSYPSWSVIYRALPVVAQGKGRH